MEVRVKLRGHRPISEEEESSVLMWNDMDLGQVGLWDRDKD